MARKSLLWVVSLTCCACITLTAVFSYSVLPSPTEAQQRPKMLALYAYFEKNSFYADTLRFFIAVGVRPSDPLDYVFIIQGGKCSVSIPHLTNVKVLKRPNDCFDFGAYGETIASLGGLEVLEKSYTAVLFLNPSTVGPILPKYWPRELHWSAIFLERLRNGVHLVGTSLVCLPRKDAGGYGPRVEGMAWAATFSALAVAWKAGVFNCFHSKTTAIIDGEYGLSRAVLAAGMNLDSLLLQYGDVDWRAPANWDCNNNIHPTRNGTYGAGMSVHPLEVVFHKPSWMWDGQVLSSVYVEELRAYMKWALQRQEAGTTEALEKST